MPQDFNMRVGVTAEVDKSKIQAQITKETKNIDINVNVKVDKAEAQKAVQKVFDKDKLDKQGREYFTKTTGILKQVKDYYKKNGAISIDISNQQKANGQIKSFTATVTEATGVIKKFNYERGKINTGGTKANYGFVQTDNVGVLDKLSGTKLKQTDDFLSKIQTRISDINSKTFNQSKPLLSVENSDKYNTVLTNTQDRITSITKSTKILSDDHKREIGTMIADLDRYRKELQNVEYAGTKLKPDTFTDTKAILQSQLGTNIQKWDSSNIFDGNFKKNVLDAKNLLDNATNPEGLDKYRAKLKLLNEDFKQTKQSSKDQQSLLNLKSDKDILKNQITTYMNQNTKATKIFGNELLDIQNKLKNVDNVTDLKNLKKDFASIKSESSALGVTGSTVLQKFKSDIGNFMTFIIGGGAVMSAIGSAQQLVSTVVELDKNIVDLQMATGYTNSETQKLLNTYIEMGKQLGATGTEVATAASDYLRQGKTIAETNKLITDSMVLSKIGNIDSASATTYLTTAMKGYGVAVDDVIGIVDKLSTVDMISATSSGGLAEAMSQTATNANMAGVSMDKLIGYLAIVGETSGAAMSSVGNSFSTMFSRMANIKLKRLVDPEAAEDLNNVETSLANVDIKLRSDSKTFREFDDVLDDVAGKWGTLSEVNQRAIAVSIAGKDHMEDFLILMQNYGKATEYTNASLDSSGTAMEKFSNYEQSVEAKTKALQASLQGLASDTLDSQVVKSFLDVSNALINLTDNVGLFNIAILAATGIISGKNLLVMFPAIEEGVYGLATSMGVASGTATTLGAVMSTVLPVAGALVAITAVTKLYDYFNVSLEEAQENVDKLQSEFDSLQSELTNANTELETTGKRIDELNGKDSLTIVEQDELKKLKETNSQLETNISLLKTQKDLKNADLNKAIKTEYNKQYGEESSVQKTIAESDTAWYDQSQYVGTEQGYVEYEIKRLEELNTVKEKGVSLTKDEQKEYDKIKKYLTNAGLDYADFASRYTVDDETKESWVALADLINKAVNPDARNEKKFTDLYDSDSFRNEKQALEDMAKEGTLSPEVISSNKEYKKLLDDTGYSAEQVVEHITAVATAAKNSGSSAKSSFEDTFDASTFASAKDELLALAEAGKLSEDTLSSTDKYKSLLDDTGLSAEELVKYIQGIADSTLSFSEASEALSASQSAISDLKDEVKDTKSISVDTINSLISKYPQLSNVFMDYLNGVKTEKDVITSLTGVYNTDLENYKTLCLGKKIYDTDFYNSVLQKLPTWVSDLASSYGVDLSNFKSLAEAKAAVEENLVKASMKMWAKYYDKVANAEADSSTDEGIRNEKFLQIAAAKREAAKSITGALDDISIDMSGIKTPTFKADTSGGSGKSKSGSGSSSDSKEEIDWIARKLEVLSKALDVIKAKASDTFSTFSSRLKSVDKAIGKVNSQLKVYQKSYSEYMSAANGVGLSASLKSKVQNGSYDITEYGSKTAEKIKAYQDYYDAAQDAKDKITELKATEKEYAEQKIDLIQSKFASKTGFVDSTISLREAKIGDNGTTKDYTYLATQQKKNLAYKQDEYKEVKEQFDAMVNSGQIEEYTQKWFDYREMLVGIKTEIEDAKDSTNDYINLAANAKFTAFEKLLETLTNVEDSISHVSSLLSGDSFSGKNMTSTGLTQQYLNLQGLANAKTEILEFQSALSMLNRSDFADDDAYNERLKQLTDGLQSAQSSVKSYRDAIVDLIKQGIEAETDAMRDYIDVQKKALDSEEALNNYKKSIEEKTSNISTLQRKINELKLSSDRKDIALRLELEKDLADAQDDLEETKADHNLEIKESALDNELSAYETAQDEKLKMLDNNLTYQENAIANSLAQIKGNYSSIYAEIAELSKTYGESIKDNIVSPTTKALASLQTGLSGDVSKTASIVSGVGSAVAIGGATNPKDAIINGILHSGTGTGNATDSLTKHLLSNGYTALSRSEMVSLASVLGLSGIKDVSDVAGNDSTNRTKILKALKKAGFKNGGIGTDYSSGSLHGLIKQAGEDKIGLFRNGEGFVAPEHVPYIKDLLNVVPTVDSLLTSSNFTNLVSNPNRSQVNLEITSPLITVTGVARDDINAQIYTAMEKVPDIVGNAIYSQLK